MKALFQKIKNIGGADKHKYDLDSPIPVTWNGIPIYSAYACKKCGNILHLDKWQIKDLPYETAHGCTGHKNDSIQ